MVSSIFLWNRRKTLTGSPDPTRANGTNKPCNRLLPHTYWRWVYRNLSHGNKCVRLHETTLFVVVINVSASIDLALNQFKITSLVTKKTTSSSSTSFHSLWRSAIIMDRNARRILSNSFLTLVIHSAASGWNHHLYITSHDPWESYKDADFFPGGTPDEEEVDLDLGWHVDTFCLEGKKHGFCFIARSPGPLVDNV